MSAEQLAVACHRFGLGARPGDLSEIGAVPVKALLDDIASAMAPDLLAGLSDSPSLYAMHLAVQEDRKARRDASGAARTATAGAMTAAATAPDKSDPASAPMSDYMGMPHSAEGMTAQGGKAPPTMEDTAKTLARDVVLEEIAARMKLARAAHFGFGERLAMFWANHFSVSGANEAVRVMCGAFEREAIRPHLGGTFQDMLEAAESHPAMLLYLNNERSMGPNSPAGQRQGKGLNENLGRETLELHTLGVDGGYTQADVTSLASAITGWSVVGRKDPDGAQGNFVFRSRMHEPGSKRILGRDYPDEGRAQGQAILGDLARHSATAHHIAFKLVRHFLSDEPDKSTVAAVARVFTDAGGKLMPVYEALLNSEGAFTRPLRKMRPPVDFAYASLRALECDVEPKRFMRSMALLGQRPYQAPSPQGWPDDSAAWLAPDAIRVRLEMANGIAQSAVQSQPLERAKNVLGPLLSEETASAIEHAESSKQALALLLMAPEFQRR